MSQRNICLHLSLQSLSAEMTTRTGLMEKTYRIPVYSTDVGVDVNGKFIYGCSLQECDKNHTLANCVELAALSDLRNRTIELRGAPIGIHDHKVYYSVLHAGRSHEYCASDILQNLLNRFFQHIGATDGDAVVIKLDVPMPLFNSLRELLTRMFPGVECIISRTAQYKASVPDNRSFCSDFQVQQHNNAPEDLSVPNPFLAKNIILTKKNQEYETKVRTLQESLNQRDKKITELQAIIADLKREPHFANPPTNDTSKLIGNSEELRSKNEPAEPALKRRVTRAEPSSPKKEEQPRCTVLDSDTLAQISGISILTQTSNGDSAMEFVKLHRKEPPEDKRPVDLRVIDANCRNFVDLYTLYVSTVYPEWLGKLIEQDCKNTASQSALLTAGNNTTDDSGKTAFMRGVESGLENVRYWLRHTDMNMKDNAGHTTMMKWIIKIKSEPPLWVRQSDMNATDRTKQTAMMKWIYRTKREPPRWMRQKKTDLQDIYGHTAAMKWIKYNRTELPKWLKQKDPNLTDKEGNTLAAYRAIYLNSGK